MSQQQIQKSHKNGFLLLETLVAIVILGMIIVSVYPLINFLLRRSKRSQYEARAALLLQEGMEAAYYVLANSTGTWITSYPDEDLSGVVYYTPAVSGTTWELIPGSTEQLLETRFTRGIRFRCIKDGSSLVPEPDFIVCTDPNVDLDRRIVRTTIEWTEAGINYNQKADLLLIKNL